MKNIIIEAIQIGIITAATKISETPFTISQSYSPIDDSIKSLEHKSGFDAIPTSPFDENETPNKNQDILKQTL